MSNYCPECGSKFEREPTPEQEEERAIIRVEEIRAETERYKARLALKGLDEELAVTEHVAEVSADAEVLSAVAESAAIEAGLEAGQEPAPEPMPIQVVNDDQDQGEMPPPERDSSEIPKPKHETSRNYFGL